MKNPQITTKLRHMMEQEKVAKLDAIACILDNYRLTSPNMDFNSAFNDLYDLELYELNDILSDLISEMFCKCLVSVGKI